MGLRWVYLGHGSFLEPFTVAKGWNTVMGQAWIICLFLHWGSSLSPQNYIGREWGKGWLPESQQGAAITRKKNVCSFSMIRRLLHMAGNWKISEKHRKENKIPPTAVFLDRPSGLSLHAWGNSVKLTGCPKSSNVTWEREEMQRELGQDSEMSRAIVVPCQPPTASDHVLPASEQLLRPWKPPVTHPSTIHPSYHPTYAISSGLRTGFKSRSQHLAVWLWVNYLTILCLSFLICKGELIVVSTAYVSFEDKMR